MTKHGNPSNLLCEDLTENIGYAYKIPKHDTTPYWVWEKCWSDLVTVEKPILYQSCQGGSGSSCYFSVPTTFELNEDSNIRIDGYCCAQCKFYCLYSPVPTFFFANFKDIRILRARF